jgi:hypothetical protein
MTAECCHLIDLNLKPIGPTLIQLPNSKENRAYQARHDAVTHDQMTHAHRVSSPLIYRRSNHDDYKARNERQQVPRPDTAQCVTLTFERLAVELDASAQTQVARCRTD